VEKYILPENLKQLFSFAFLFGHLSVMRKEIGLNIELVIFMEKAFSLCVGLALLAWLLLAVTSVKSIKNRSRCKSTQEHEIVALALLQQFNQQPLQSF